MYSKRILNSSRVRKIQGSFSWIDHRFITGGFLRDLSAVEILLYFFLVTVSDRNGISFYHDDKICSLIKIGLTSLGEAREGLISQVSFGLRASHLSGPFIAVRTGNTPYKGRNHSAAT